VKQKIFRLEIAVNDSGVVQMPKAENDIDEIWPNLLGFI
jgi:hypothetical protein